MTAFSDEEQGKLSGFSGKVAIVTGGANGIGAATARTLAARGAHVVIADILAEEGDTRAAEISEAGGSCIAITTDVSSEEDVRKLIGETAEKFGRIDVMHNNAAAIELTAEDTEVTTLSVDIWDRTLRASALGVMQGCKHVIPVMLENGGGAIVNTSSVAGASGALTMTAYGVAKAAVSQLTRAVATQWSKRGIRCNAVAPSMIVTDHVREAVAQEFIDIYLRNSLTPYVGKPQDVANAVAFLASEEARYITGQVLYADGGFLSAAPIAADLRDEGTSGWADTTEKLGQTRRTNV
jgi:NAD(P)-dependent dehydrogenase (short-subunit alcohol dehydrogenase family)